MREVIIQFLSLSEVVQNLHLEDTTVWIIVVVITCFDLILFHPPMAYLAENKLLNSLILT